MKLYIIRHGQTDWNKQNKLQSYSDIPLNETGMQQAQNTSKFLQNEQIDFIITSPLIRAQQTAIIINKPHQKEIKIHKEITERNYGKFEGQNYHQVTHKMIEIFENNLYKEHEIETPKQLETRIKPFWEKFHKQHYGKNIIIVSHSGAIKMLLSIIQNLPYEQVRRTIKKKNASITIIEFEKPFKIKNIQIGIDEHLD